MNIVRSKERIQSTGEVFTPDVLVDEILSKIEPELFKDPSKTFIDPACGDGNFLVQVLQRKLDGGSTPAQALSTIFGVDIMPDNIERCQDRLLHIVVKRFSATETDLDKYLSIIERNIVCDNALSPDRAWFLMDDC